MERNEFYTLWGRNLMKVTTEGGDIKGIKGWVVSVEPVEMNHIKVTRPDGGKMYLDLTRKDLQAHHTLGSTIYSWKA